MTSKKIIAYISVVLIVAQSPIITIAAYSNQTPTFQDSFTEGFIQGLDNPDQTIGDLETGLDKFKPTYREQFHINKIAKQLEKIIEKADTNEAKMQKQ